MAFSSKNRILGVAAKNQLVTNMKNTVHGFKRLLGRKFDDPSVQAELQHLPYKVERGPDGNLGIRVSTIVNNKQLIFNLCSFYSLCTEIICRTLDINISQLGFALTEKKYTGCVAPQSGIYILS